MEFTQKLGSSLINDTSISLDSHIVLKSKSYFKLLVETTIDKDTDKKSILPILSKIKGQPVEDRQDFIKIRLSQENLEKFQEIMGSSNITELFSFILTLGEKGEDGSLNVLSSYLPSGNILLEKQFLIHQLGNTFLAFTYLNGAPDYDLFIESFVESFHDFRSENSNTELFLEGRVRDADELPLGANAAEKERELHREIKHRALKSVFKKIITSPSLFLGGLSLGISGLSLLYLGQIIPVMPLSRLYSLGGLLNAGESPYSRTPRLRDVYDIGIKKLYQIILDK